MQNHEAQPATNLVEAESQMVEWQKPVATFLAASSTANGPGSMPDSGVDYS